MKELIRLKQAIWPCILVQLVEKLNQNVSVTHPILKVINSKNPIDRRKMSSKKIPKWFGYKTIDHINFCKDFMKNQLTLIVSKKVADRSDFVSIKHLKSVLYLF